jgi:hypothetical protein
MNSLLPTPFLCASPRLYICRSLCLIVATDAFIVGSNRTRPDLTVTIHRHRGTRCCRTIENHFIARARMRSFYLKSPFRGRIGLTRSLSIAKRYLLTNYRIRLRQSFLFLCSRLFYLHFMKMEMQLISAQFLIPYYGLFGDRISADGSLRTPYVPPG